MSLSRENVGQFQESKVQTVEAVAVSTFPLDHIVTPPQQLIGVHLRDWTGKQQLRCDIGAGMIEVVDERQRVVSTSNKKHEPIIEKFCSIVVYPVIPKGLIELRLIPTAVHTLEDVDRTLKAFSEVAEKLEKGYYKEQKLATV